MKVKKLNILLILMALMILPNISFSQDVVIVPDNIGGNPLDALSIFIANDTSSTGGRDNPDRIYKLERGKIYLMGKPLQVDFNLNLVADDDDPANPTRPPMLARAYDIQGAMAGALFMFNTDSLHITMKNLFFNGIQMPDADNPKGRLYGGYGKPLLLRGSGTKVEVDKCVFSGWGVMGTGSAVDFSFKFTNNIVRNAVDYINPWGGMVIDNNKDCDSLIFVNNTFFNVSSYIVLTNRAISNYVLFDHNTIFINTINGFFMPYITDARITNNLIYGYVSMGQLPEEIFGGWYDWDNQICGIASITTVDPNKLADAGLTKADREVIYENNGYAWPSAFTDYWNSIDTMEATVWMNERTKGMYSDKSTYPLLYEGGNLEADPGFEDASMVSTIVAKELEFVKAFRNDGLSGTGGIDRTYVPDGEYWDVAWPLPENLKYTNTTLLTKATGSFPVGDLNWYPDKKAEWVEWCKTDIRKDDNASVPSEYKLSQNYPNPFNPTTEINFSIPASGNVSLAVYNVLGQKVATLVNKELTAGAYKYQFDASNLTSGIYFYKLQANNYSQVRKMLLLK